MVKFNKLALATVAGIALAAAPAAWAQGQGKTIGLAVANLQADFFNIIKQGVETYGKEKGYKVITVDAKGDATTQVNQIQDLIAQKIDALIYIPAERGKTVVLNEVQVRIQERLAPECRLHLLQPRERPGATISRQRSVVRIFFQIEGQYVPWPKRALHRLDKVGRLISGRIPGR